MFSPGNTVHLISSSNCLIKRTELNCLLNWIDVVGKRPKEMCLFGGWGTTGGKINCLALISWEKFDYEVNGK